jgi:nucleotide-binding universal stress UspA family protein
MFHRILVPLDGTAFGDHALPYAISIARRTGATLELTHVHQRVETDPRLAALSQFQFEHVEKIRAADDDEAWFAEGAALEERAADIAMHYGVRVITRVLHGSTARALTHEATDTAADLVVMATHARSGLPRLRHGDLAHHLVTRLNIPALCVRPSRSSVPVASAAIRRVLVALDGSEFSEQILDRVVPLAYAIGARLALLHVVSPPGLMIAGFDDLRPPIPHREEALRYLGHLAERIPAAMPQPELIAVEADNAAPAIIAELGRSPHHALAIATHGRSGLSRMILGSVAEEVLRATGKPVLLYRPRLTNRAGELVRSIATEDETRTMNVER